MIFLLIVAIAININIIFIYCILYGWIKGFNRSITTIVFEVGSYRTVVGYSYRMLE